MAKVYAKTHLGHADGKQWRQVACDALDELVASAREIDQEAVRREIGFEVMRWAERATPVPVAERNVARAPKRPSR